ncbi:hypothetical protein HK405_007268 [Cladochytrium tenue]|nr:hypothetical protein HK405_007268 [Cladochytrium tenue]
MSADDIYNTLKKGQGRLSVKTAKQAFAAFSSKLESLSNEEKARLKPAAVVKQRIFPIRTAGGGVELREGNSNFVISNKHSLASGFEGKVDFLDFTEKEIEGDLAAFILWADMKEKFISTMAKKKVEVKNRDHASPVKRKEYEIKRTARALLSIAVAHKSPRAADQDSLFGRLRNAKTLEADDIVEVYQLGDAVYEAQSNAIVHIDEDTSSGALKLYIPRDSEKQRSSFSIALPKALAAWMQPAAVGEDVAEVVGTVLHLPPSLWKNTLKSYDINLIDKDGADELEADVEEDAEHDRGISIRHAIPALEPSDQRKLEIGGKGEQHIFNYFSELNLPEFNETNWLSKANNNAISDFKYVDTHGAFANWLDQRGAFDLTSSRPVSNGAVTYYIEVKSTTGGCDMPIYVTNNQFQLMRKHSRAVAPEGEWSTIYVILRVYNVESDAPQIGALVDPLSMICRGEVSVDNQPVLLSCRELEAHADIIYPSNISFSL